MPLELCPICARMHYSTDACKESTAARKDVQREGLNNVSEAVASKTERQAEVHGERLGSLVAESGESRFNPGMPAGTQALPVDTTPAQAANPLERISKANGPDDTQLVRSNAPKPVNRNEYHKFSMRRYRARLRAKKAAEAVNGVNAPANG